ncbi:YunG family protein [Streptomyces graminilatus]|uniref:YunG family protein n=1 Tax=Streptomyces graminilatus TaxID=1464070 RepID=UPI00099F083B|nr:hypothetical protein [Streptomyces graminilatus]
MDTITLSGVEAALRASWGVDTCAPEDVPKWHPGNPARGQCGVTALVVHDLFGGDLVCGEVRVEGEVVDYHWWNRFGQGIEIDLTREQFGPGESVGPGEVVVRPPGPPGHCREQYQLLRRRVFARLGPAGAGSPGTHQGEEDHLGDTAGHTTLV